MSEIDYNQIFNKRYNRLNEAQQAAVDHIDGPLMVVAGPGTGKTELLTMRTANILRMTDVLPSNILCLTFTEAAATNMKRRLADIIGDIAYQAEISTFHGFGVTVMGRYSEYFASGAELKAADDITRGEIIDDILAELSYDNPLSSNFQGAYTYRNDILSLISDLKQADITPDDLRAMCQQNLDFIEKITPDINDVILGTNLNRKADKVKVVDGMAEVAVRAEAVRNSQADLNFTDQPKLATLFAHSLSDAVAACREEGKTKAYTAWRGKWIEASEGVKGKYYILKDEKRSQKLLLAADIYEKYNKVMAERGLYDFDDMIMQVIEAIQKYPDLKANLQEQYQYILVDEFQDTNDAQMKILKLLSDYDDPNLMVVGDDDQAIYRFQGADISNILNFASWFPSLTQINLTENYRSGADILASSTGVAAGITERLTNIDGTPKRLNAARGDEIKTNLTRIVMTTANEECNFIADMIDRILSQHDSSSNEIAVIARNHKSLEKLVPFLSAKHIQASYDRQENVFDSPLIQLILNLAGLIEAIYRGDSNSMNEYLPEVLADSHFGVSAEEFYSLSLNSNKRSATQWLEKLTRDKKHAPLVEWLQNLATKVPEYPLNQMLAELVGLPHVINSDSDEDAPEQTNSDEGGYHSPIYDAYFNYQKLDTEPTLYLNFLDDLNELINSLSGYQPDKQLKIADLLNFAKKCHELDIKIFAKPHLDTERGVQLMTAHGSKGLEFDTVIIMDAENNIWGPDKKNINTKLPLASNMPFGRASGSDDDERRRLLYVAMTRAKRNLVITSHSDNDGKSLTPVVYLDDNFPSAKELASPDNTERAQILETSLFGRVTIGDSLRQELLKPRLDKYRLSATDMYAFLDVGHGGPQNFVMYNLLHVPQRITPPLILGNAVHATMEQLHRIANADEPLPSIDDAVMIFECEFDSRCHEIADSDAKREREKGIDDVRAYLEQHLSDFKKGQRQEQPFKADLPGNIRLTGKLDCVNVNAKEHTIDVIDYKTGHPLRTLDPKGKQVYNQEKAHKYKYQLLFYKLLVESSTEYPGYKVKSGRLDFVEPDPHTKQIDTPVIDYSDSEELVRFKQLVISVWRLIQAQIWPDVSGYSADLKGTIAFEEDILAGKFL